MNLPTSTIATLSKHPNLEWVHKNRIAERLVGPFDFTHVGRSFDGGRVAADGKMLNRPQSRSPQHLGRDLRLEVVAKPWLRVGVFRSSGDDNPSDGDHDTVFQLLPTSRIYAFAPFYNLMNNQDGMAAHHPPAPELRHSPPRLSLGR